MWPEASLEIQPKEAMRQNQSENAFSTEFQT